MNGRRLFSAWILFGSSLALTSGCGKKPLTSASVATSARHEHRPPHGGTAVVLGDETYHLELVRESGSGTLQVFVLDGEMENFIRCSATTLEIDAIIDSQPKTLVLTAVANPATGETVGETALFETHADWLKTVANFDGMLKKFTIRGTTFSEVKFNFPKGNDQD